MGTKTNPGAFNCYGAALPDEPIFTILGRDPTFRATILYWMAQRGLAGKNESEEDLSRITEAATVADAGRAWRLANLDPVGDGVPSWKLPRPEPEPGDDRPVRWVDKPEGEGVRVSIQWLLGLAERLRAAPDLNDPRRIAEELELATGTVEFNGFNQPAECPHQDTVIQYTGDKQEVTFCRDCGRNIALNGRSLALDKFDNIENYGTNDIPGRPEKAQSDMVDLAAAPIEVPPHRFSYFYKGERYAYARGLEINPTHLPLALDEMTKDGWNLLAIFGQTDSASVGFIFERPNVDQYEEPEDRSWVQQRLGLPPVAEQRFLPTLTALRRVHVVYLALADRGEDCRRYAVSILAASGIHVDDCGSLYGRTGDNMALGHAAAQLEQVYWDDREDGCAGLGRGMEP